MTGGIDSLPKFFKPEQITLLICYCEALPFDLLHELIDYDINGIHIVCLATSNVVAVFIFL